MGRFYFFTEFGEDGEELDADEVAYHGEGVEEAEGAGVDAGVGVGDRCYNFYVY